ncbi:hypothetical protein [Longimicrobium terrae]|uniref:DNA-binding PadR family transcriptional regulator n=1 Tax=Longimicrobium terrae TaxID=1639882 RepID=A0A841GN26_9BACT|nr:hypothetical protein [Longimicrobium terrae]MBB4635643.1 DNA-binding PadR family transcriptional regulator [Longimicrobium terrae]MBB6070037.1 DNA-binding PadR family transcriptional regulator [Longimicrobium terrae]NNC32943.1 hypothetical protein [Longimicrobium terrae]
MVRPDYLGGTAANVLSWLWNLDARAGGYTRRGVRGWARREDVEAGLKIPIPELLPRLRDRGLLEEDHVHVPGTRPVAVYRITGLGDLLLARTQGREALPPWPAGLTDVEDDAVYLPPGPSSALRLLRDVVDCPSTQVGIGSGWRTEDELRDQFNPEPEGWDETDTGPWLVGDPPWKHPVSSGGAESNTPVPHGFDRAALAWLERAGLVERTTFTPPKRKRPIVFWRISQVGAQVDEIVWHQPQG